MEDEEEEKVRGRRRTCGPKNFDWLRLGCGPYVLALCTGMRPVVMMIDYGGKMHDLQDRFSKIASLLLSSSSNITTCMVEPSKESNLGMQLTSIQKLFSSTFPLHGSNNDTTTALDEANSSQPSLFIDLSCCLQDTKIWLLEYPVVYLFGTYHIEDAIYNLPTKSLRIFKVLVQRGEYFHLEELTSSSVPYELSMKSGLKHFWRG
ncbi:uncharacterized protein LOC106372782 [Brassica napus]|uniref:uncharacterized protein LOC106372782 n=1 Tax=Brassica napus TaxID=3708 RepID=UPI002079247D|nr:uncharacterized protein LOC106372782 [Brassica napus]